MTSPGSGPSPLKVGGIALIGVAVVAAVIGLVGLGTGGGSGSGGATVAAPTESVSPATPGTSAAPSTSDAVPVPSFSAAPAPATTTAPQVVTPPVVDNGGTSAAPTMPLRVYNNSTIQGLAAKASSDFERGGWPVTSTTGYPYGTIPTSTVYYIPGTGEQASAERLAADYGLQAQPRFEGIRDASPGLIVIVTKDYRGGAS